MSILRFNSTLVRLKQNDTENNWQYLRGFNSTLVRLKLIANEIYCDTVCCFNSTLVRLKLGMPGKMLSTNWFQFHSGSIKTFRGHFRRQFQLCFNSTLVRLKPNGITKPDFSSNAFSRFILGISLVS